MFCWFCAKRSKQRSSVKSKARITSHSTGLRYAQPVNSSVMCHAGVGLSNSADLCSGKAFKLQCSPFVYSVVNSTGVLLQRAAPGWAH